MRMRINVPCVLCGVTNSIECSKDGYRKWQGGALVQDAFPELDASQRELLISGVCPTCWDNMFAD